MPTLQNNKWFIAFTVAISLIIFGCHSSHIMKSTVTVNKDSTTVSKVVATVVKDTASKVVHQVVKSDKQTVTVKFANNDIVTNEWFKTHHPVTAIINTGDTTGDWSVQSAIEYLETKKPKTTIIADIPITSSQDIQSVTFTTQGHSNTIDLTSQAGHDSSTSSASSNTHTATNIKDVSKDKKTSGLGFMFYVWLTVVAGGTYLVWHFGGLDWLLAFFKRKKDNTG